MRFELFLLDWFELVMSKGFEVMKSLREDATR